MSIPAESMSAIDFLPDEDEVLFVSMPSSNACSRTTMRTDDAVNGRPRRPSSTADRNLMPPPSFVPIRPTKTKSPLAMKPVQFVSNSVQASTFGTTYRRNEEAQRNTVIYETTYKYKKPNYVVTDVPDLWTNSAMLVESCDTGNETRSEKSHVPIAQSENLDAEKTSLPKNSGRNLADSPNLLPESREQNSSKINQDSVRNEESENSPSSCAMAMDGTLIDQLFMESTSSSDITAEVLEAMDPSLNSSSKDSAMDIVNRTRKRERSRKENGDGKEVKDHSRSKKHRKKSRGSSPKKSRDPSDKKLERKKKGSPHKKKTELLGKKKKKGSKSDKSSKKKRSKKTGLNGESDQGTRNDLEDGEISEMGDVVKENKKQSDRKLEEFSERKSQTDMHESHRRHSSSEQRCISEHDSDRYSGLSLDDFDHPDRNVDWFEQECRKRGYKNGDTVRNNERSRSRSPDSYLSHREKAVDWEDEERGMSSWFMREQRHREKSVKAKSYYRDRGYLKQNLHEVGHKYSDSDRHDRHERSVDRSSRHSTEHRNSRSRSPSRSHSKSASSREDAEKRSSAKPTRTPVSFSIKKAAHGSFATGSTDTKGAMKDILDLLEKHLLKASSGKENGEASSESDSDTESVASISKMSVFGEKLKPPKKRKYSLDTSQRRARSRSPDKRARLRRRSLSPVSVFKRTRPSRRRSVSPTMTVISRRRSPAHLRRRHRASSFDTIASSQIDCEKLREAAIRNVIELRRMGKIPPEYTMSKEERALWRSGGKSLEDLTAFCKRMAQRSREGDRESSVASELPVYHHPYHVKDRPLLTEIIMHINNARVVPVKTQQERIALNLPLRELYPVSTGSGHRDLTWQRIVSHEREERYGEHVVAKKKAPKEKEKHELTLEEQLRTQPPPPDYRIPVSFSDKLRLLKFQRELAKNPDNPYILSQMQDTHQQMLEWANQFAYQGNPGEFTGTAVEYTSVSSFGEKQAWARKDQLMNLKPVGGKGQYLLQKMGWCPGQPLGLGQHGTLEPLKMTIKMDKRGLVAKDEVRGKQPISFHGVKTVSFPGYEHQHPCSALNEVCTKNGWGTPSFVLVEEGGQAHRKTFLFQVIINGIEYRPTVAGCSKRIAKAEAAKFCLQAIGVNLKTDP